MNRYGETEGELLQEVPEPHPADGTLWLLTVHFTEDGLPYDYPVVQRGGYWYVDGERGDWDEVVVVRFADAYRVTVSQLAVTAAPTRTYYPRGRQPHSPAARSLEQELLRALRESAAEEATWD